MAFPIGEGEVRVRINDRDLLAGLARDEAEVRSRFRSMDRMRAEPEVRADIDKFTRKMREAESKLDFFKKQRAEATVDADKSKFDRKVAATLAQIKMLDAQRAEIAIELDEKRLRDANRSFGRLKQNLRDFQREAERANIPGARLFGTLGKITARVGPFTMSIKQAVIAAALFAPMIVSIVGALGALTAVVGSGLVGGLTVAGAGMLGFGMAAGGVFAVVKPLTDDIKKHFAPAVKDLGERWGKLTRESRRPIFQAARESIQDLNKLLPMFARNANQSTQTAARGMRSFTSMLAGAGRGDISTIWSSFNKGLRPALSGVRNITQALLRIGASASRFFEPLGQAFENWSQGILKATGNTKRLDAVIDRMAGDFKLVWNFSKEAVKAVKNLIAPGRGAGADWLKDMTDGLKDFNKWATSVTGRSELSDFFRDSVKHTKELWAALKPIGKTFLEWAEAMRPFSEAFLAVVQQISEFAEGLMSLSGGKAVVQGLMALFVASKIWNMVRAVEALGMALLGLSGRGALAAGAGGGLPLLLGGGRGGKGGGKGMFPLFGGRGGRGGKGSFFTGGPIVLDDGAVTKDAARSGSKWKGMLGRSLSKGRVLTAGGAALTIGSFLIPPTGEDPAVNEAVDQVKKNIDRAVAARHAKKANLKLAHLLNISQLDAMDIGNKIMRGINDGIAKAEGQGDNRLADSLRRQSRRVQNTLSKLTKTKQGAKFVMEIETRGGKEAQAMFARLAAHKFGRKLLEIISRGGPQAARWLANISRTKLGDKLMRIVEKGGPQAAKLVQKLANAKIRDKVMKIVDKGGPLAVKRLEKLLGIDLPDKNFTVRDIGTMNALSNLRNLDAFKLADKRTHVSAETGQAVAAIGSVKNLISSIPAVKNVVINVAANVAAGARKFTRAGGGSMAEDPMEKAMRMSMAPKMTKGGRYDHPTFLTGDHGGKGGPAEVVISPDPSVRDSNIAYWKMAARMLKIPGFAEGYGGASSPAGYDKALERLTGPRSLIERKKQHISNLEKNYDQADRRFTTQMGETEFLNEDGSRNEGVIQQRLGQLSSLLSMKDAIADAWRELINAIDQAMNSVRDFIHQMRAGLKKMPDMVKRHTGEKKKTEMVPNERKKALAEKLAEFQNVMPGLRDERTAASEGLEDIGLDRDDLIATMFAIGGTKESTTPEERKLSGLEAAAALAGITPGTEDDTSSTKALLEYHYGQIEKAKAMLADQDPGNDSTAYQMLSQSGGAIPGLQDTYAGLTGKFYGDYTGSGGAGGGGGTGNTGILAETSALSGARADLYRQYGSNYMPMGGGGAGKIVNVTNNYQTQPVDPHTWTSQLQWELEAIL